MEPAGVWQLHELAIKAAPLILIAVGLSVCYVSNNWNIGAEGQFIVGAIVGSIIPVLLPDFQSWMVLPLMLILGMVGGAAYGAIPAFLKTRFNTNEILTSLMLVYVGQAASRLAGARALARSRKASTSRRRSSSARAATLPEIMPMPGRANWGIVFALVAAVRGLVHAAAACSRASR